MRYLVAEYRTLWGAINAESVTGSHFTQNDWYSTFHHDPSPNSYDSARVGAYIDEDGVVKFVSGHYDILIVQHAVRP